MNLFARKICLLGDFSVGKTSSVARYVRSTYSEQYLTTVGVKVDTKTISSADGTTVRLVIWDIAGSSRLGQARLNYVTGAHGFVLVADGTRRDTVASALDLWRQAAHILQTDIPAVLLINKLDLADEWEVSPELIHSLSKTLPVFCTSAKTGESIEAAFQTIAKAASHETAHL